MIKQIKYKVIEFCYEIFLYFINLKKILHAHKKNELSLILP